MADLVNIKTHASAAGLHVVTITPFYPTHLDDSSGCFIAESLDPLAKLGVKHTILAAQPFYRGRFCNAGKALPAQWIRYFSLPGGTGLPMAGAFLFARIVGAMRKLHRENPIHLIHAHGALPCGHAAMLLSHELKIPFVVSVHGLDVFSTVQVGGRAGKWCHKISSRVYASSKRVICVSERVREQVLLGMRSNCRTSVVYNGVDVNRFAPASGPPATNLLLLSVGNLDRNKGHDVLLRASAALAAEFPSLRVEIVGDGAERAALGTLTQQLGISDRVKFSGRQPRAYVADAMRRCTLFVLPSKYEGLGCVYLEAMSSGKPAVGCRGQGIAEIIQQGSNGFLIGPDNDKELALVLSMLLKDENRRHNIGTLARDTVVERLSLEHQAEGLARIYRDTAA